jgi:hypothetical protein
MKRPRTDRNAVLKKQNSKTTLSSANHHNGRESLFNRPTILKFCIFLLLATVLSLLTPFTQSYQKEIAYKEGDITREEIIAPFDFPIYKSENELENERQEAEFNAPLIYYRNEETSEKRIAILDDFFARVDSLSHVWSAFRDSQYTPQDEPAPGMPGYVPEKEPSSAIMESNTAIDETAGNYTAEDESGMKRTVLDSLKKWNFGVTEANFEYLLDSDTRERLKYDISKILSEAFSMGIIDTVPVQWAKSPGKPVTIFKGKDTIYTTVSNLMSVEKQLQNILAEAQQAYPRNSDIVKLMYGISQKVIYPNLLYDPVESETSLDAHYEKISPYKGLILEGEMIVDSHTRVTPHHLEILNSMLRVKNEMESQEKPWMPLLGFFGQFILIGLFISFLAYYLAHFRPAIYNNNAYLLLISLILCTICVIAAITVKSERLSEYLIPVVFGTILTTLLFDVKFSLVFIMISSFIVALIAEFNYQLATVYLLGGMSAALSIRHIRKRQNFYKPTLISLATFLLVIAAYATIQKIPLKILGQRAVFITLNAFFSSLVAIEILPFLERIFKLTTNITLYEYADLNNPILRRMSIEAPGTYHHSIMVGNLSEAAAEAIGANPLLARVGSYYHDIGKIPKAEYFVENQQTFNKHEKLTPTMSTLIITSHVKEAMEMGRRMKLPQAILDIIQQHHGTSIISYFYQKALGMITHGTVNEEDYRYPGPKPQTKEAAIVMLADAVEATSRTLKEPNPSKIKGMVKKIIQGKFMDSELDESDLTLQELNKIADSFVPILTGMLHHRIDYPDREMEKNRIKSPPKVETRTTI